MTIVTIILLYCKIELKTSMVDLNFSGVLLTKADKLCEYEVVDI